MEEYETVATFHCPNGKRRMHGMGTLNKSQANTIAWFMNNI
jgi:hypothetical protein